MLREIAAARENNQASHQVSKSQLTVHNMPEKVRLLSELDSTKQGDTDKRTTGIDTSRKVLGNFDMMA